MVPAAVFGLASSAISANGTMWKLHVMLLVKLVYATRCGRDRGMQQASDETAGTPNPSNIGDGVAEARRVWEMVLSTWKHGNKNGNCCIVRRHSRPFDKLLLT